VCGTLAGRRIEPVGGRMPSPSTTLQTTIGPYRLTRRLAEGPFGRRDLALHIGAATSHVVARMDHLRPEHDRGRIEHALRTMAKLKQRHILPVQDFGFEDDRGVACVWVASPYTGDVDGLVTLESLARRKGGYLPPIEARTAIMQLLDASVYAHQLSPTVAHGAVRLNEVLVDQRGSLVIEHYGLRAMLTPGSASVDELARREVDSLVEIGYQLVTGLLPEDPVIPAGRVVPDLDPIWDDWFETGLLGPRRGGPGFRSAAHALSAIASPPPAGAAGRNERLLGLFKRLSRLLSPRV
jgi:serine/threonine protein kinase